MQGVGLVVQSKEMHQMGPVVVGQNENVDESAAVVTPLFKNNAKWTLSFGLSVTKPFLVWFYTRYQLILCLVLQGLALKAPFQSEKNQHYC